MLGKPIFPMAYRIKPNLVKKIFYLGFPSSWKEKLINISKANNPNFKSKFGLPTRALQKLVDSWMEGVVSISPLKEHSDDCQWLSSTIPFDDNRVYILFKIIQIWINATYISAGKVNPSARSMVNELCSEMKAEELNSLRTEKDVLLSTADGRVSTEAYQAIPLIVVNDLVGKCIEINGNQIHLSYVTKNELISNLITEPKYKHKYSFVFKFSVQTTPPRCEALLLCDVSMRRWIYGRKDKKKTPFLKNAITGHVRVSDEKICQIPIQYNHGTLDWKFQDKKCYDECGYKPSLPKIDELWDIVESENNNNYMLPYTNGMTGFIKSNIGTGIPVKDKAKAYEEVFVLLKDIVEKPCRPDRISTKQKLHCYKSPSEYETREDFRKWVASCTDSNKIRFELYGILSNASHNALLTAISNKIMCDFGEETCNSCLSIDIEQKEIGDIANPVKREDKISRCDKIKEKLGETNDVVACICIIPGADTDEYKDDKDPKLVIRNAFARSGRLVQFVVASTEEGLPNNQKVEHAVYDLYRQLGITTLMNTEKLKSYKLKDVTCVGMHVFTQIHNIKKTARFMPIYVSYDLSTGKTSVQCAAFKENNISYRKACLEMAKLFWNEDFEHLCADTSFSSAKQKLTEMKNCFDTENQRAVLLVHSDCNTRQLWRGISDKTISNTP